MHLPHGFPTVSISVRYVHDNARMRTAALRDHLVNGGRIERAGNRYRLIIPPTGAEHYTDAQLDDYEHNLPRHFPNRPPQRVHLRARFSHREMKGTAGFGFWNHPFSREGDVLEPPWNVWFFYSSPESDLQVARGMPGHGFKAAMLNSGQMPKGVMAIAGRLFNLALKVPGVSALAMASARAAVNVQGGAHETMLAVDMADWHEYEIDWQTDVALLQVDGREVLRAAGPPRGAMGFVAWVDNYRARATAGDYQFAYVGVGEEQWMELELLEIMGDNV
jgi:hypothetical protein